MWSIRIDSSEPTASAAARRACSSSSSIEIELTDEELSRMTRPAFSMIYGKKAV